MGVIGKITSTPDADGNHMLKCPECRITFKSPVIKDDETGELQLASCEICHYSDSALLFLQTANEEEINQMAKDYAERELSDALKKAFGNSGTISIG